MFCRNGWGLIYFAKAIWNFSFATTPVHRPCFTFNINFLQVVSWISQFTTLLPGDIILTGAHLITFFNLFGTFFNLGFAQIEHLLHWHVAGTPPGVGVFMKPPEFLKKVLILLQTQQTCFRKAWHWTWIYSDIVDWNYHVAEAVFETYKQIISRATLSNARLKSWEPLSTKWFEPEGEKEKLFLKECCFDIIYWWQYLIEHRSVQGQRRHCVAI